MSGYTNGQLKELERMFDTFFKVINKNAEIKISEINESLQQEQVIIDDVIKFIKAYDDKRYSIKIKDLVDSSETKISKEFSIIYFFVNRLWDLYKDKGPTNYRFGMTKIVEWAYNFLLELIDKRIDESHSEEIDDEGILSYLDLISNSPYEGGSLEAKLLLISKQNISEHINLVIDFKEMIRYKEIKKIRKIMEMCSDVIFAVGDNEGIYGLGHFKDYGEAFKHKLEDKIIFIHFNGKLHYDVKEVSFIKKKTTSFTEEQENVNWNYKESLIYKIRDNRIMLSDREFPKGKLRYFLNRIFPDIPESNIDKLINIVQIASYQKHGTMLVVGTKDLAKEEIDRLCKFQQAVKIEKINLVGMDEGKRNIVLNQISSIDGAIYLDSDGNVHGIGVILDGPANELGDSSRGARYNSAIKYNKSQDKINNNTLIIVVSEDGYIDIVVKEDEKYKLLLDSLWKKIGEQKYQQVLDEINDNKNDVSGIYNFNILKAVAHTSLGDHKKSVKLLKEILNIEPDNYLIYAYLAFNKDSLMEYKEALEYANKSIELNGNFKNTLLRKADLLLKLEQMEEYKEFVTGLHNNNPEDLDYKNLIEKLGKEE
ncbi:diadenylate cyclase [Bacillus cereus]|uniref:diadenylate cyclase n=1 Tax=Bacillus cereus TaxID=1396 RepID=UPI0024098757|nr:diadenylate cyclase [Bacillus cereus]MCU4996577.1 diadenylate cyclase [Bacillus cereus]MDA2267076.1 diadenylate cyclase [Bacillus cereus]MDC7777783.1 diadenylate cyclase [Bacillus cereus]